MPDIASVADGVIATVKAYVDRQIKALPEPAPGKDADIADLIPVMEAEVAKRVAEIPAPRDGTSVTVDDVAPMLREMVSDAVAAIPVPNDGKDADPEHVAALVAEAVAALPSPKDGEPGKSITLDDLRDWLEARAAAWEVDFERRAQGVLERAAERIPKPVNGQDGFSLDDLTIEDDGNGRVTLRFQRGELVKCHTVRLPRFSDKGVFREGDEYEAGDGVTWAGSYWIAQKDAPEGKPGDSDAWRLSVKRGRDGKDARLLPPVPTQVKL